MFTRVMNWRQWVLFNTGGGSGGGDGGGTGGAGAGSGGGDGGGTGGPVGGTGGGNTGGGTQTFTKEQVDAAAAAARREAEEAARKAQQQLDEQAKALGYESHADMLKKLNEQKQAQMGDLEREKAARSEAEQKAQAANARVIASEVRLAATAAGFIDIDLAQAALTAHGYELKLDEATGKVTAARDGKAAELKDAFEDLKKAKGHLFGQKGGATGAGGTAPPGGGTGAETPEQIAQRLAKERAERHRPQKSAWG